MRPSATAATLGTLLLGAVCAAGPSDGPPTYPPTRKGETKEQHFGITVADPYRWLEDGKSTEVKAWAAAQDKFARARLATLPGREVLTKRVRELVYRDRFTPPVHRGRRYFYTRQHADQEKAVLLWRDGADGEDHVLLDPNKLKSEGDTALGNWVPSHDGKLVAYVLHPNNADDGTLHVIEVASGRDMPKETIDGARYATPQWTPTNDGFYYVWASTDPKVPADQRPGYADVRFHKLGTPPARDTVLYPKTGDPTISLATELSRDGRWLCVTILHGWNAMEAGDVHVRDLHDAKAKWKPLAVSKDAQFRASAWEGHFYIWTNDGAPRGRVFKTAVDQPERKHWQEIIPQAASAVVQNVQVLGGRLALTALHNALNEVDLYTLDGKHVRKLPLPALGSTGNLEGNPDSDDAYFTFESFAIPPCVFRTSLRDGKTSIWARSRIHIDATLYRVEQVCYPSKDGTRVSMFVVQRKGLPRDGSTPFLLTGYGGFGDCESPYYSSGEFAWLEAGGGLALPNLRGGGEYGEEWHKAGMLERKQTVFDDFLAAGDWLVKQGYTRPERLALRGASNGGLLVAAALVQRPDLFRAVICESPLTDMLRYHLFGEGRTWVPEYGSPDDATQFKALFGYSPYHRLRPGTRYPAVLVMAGDSDDRVDSMHARKFAAALQECTASPRPVLLRIEKNAGHMGADQVRSALDNYVDMFSFVMHEVGMKPMTP